MTTARIWTFVRRIGVAFAVYALFWLVLTGLAAWHIGNVIRYIEDIAFTRGREVTWTFISLGAAAWYVAPVLTVTILIAYSGLTTWLLAWQGSSEAQFQVRVLRNEILMLAGVGITLVLSMFPTGIGIR